MLKHRVLTVLMTMLFAVTPAMAGDKDDLSQEYKDNLEDNRESKNMPHPAHEMGSDSNPFKEESGNKDKHKKSDDKNKYKSSGDKKNMSQEYKDNLEANRESKNMPHPAHEMGSDSNPFKNSCAEMGQEISSDTIKRCQDYLDQLQGN